MRKYLARAVILIAALQPARALAVEPDSGEERLVGPPPYVQLMLSGLTASPSVLGGEAGAGLLLIPFEGRGLVVGPRISALVAGGSGATRFDLNTGAEGSLYFANAIAPGFAVDLVYPSTVSPDLAAGNLHFRWDSFLSIRAVRFRQEGAWAVRAGLTYDTFYKFGLHLGLTLQLSGVPSVVEALGL